MTTEDLQGQVARSAAVERELRDRIRDIEEKVAQQAATIEACEGREKRIDTLAAELEQAKRNTEEVALASQDWAQRAHADEEALRGMLIAVINKDANPDLDGEGQPVCEPYSVCTMCGWDGDPDADAIKHPHDPAAACGKASAALAREPSVFQTAALAACAYLAAQAALAAAGTSPERPDAARRLAEAWIALTRACKAIQPVVWPAQDGAGADLPRSGIPLIDHDYVPTPHPAVDACDKRVSDNPDGRPSRQCGRPRREHRNHEGGK